MGDVSRNVEEDESFRTMTTCGEVLLDTMDHILDYARMSTCRKNQIPKSEKPQGPGGLVSSNGITCIDFCNLVESVVEGVLAGWYSPIHHSGFLGRIESLLPP